MIESRRMSQNRSSCSSSKSGRRSSSLRESQKRLLRMMIMATARQNVPMYSTRQEQQMLTRVMCGSDLKRSRSPGHDGIHHRHCHCQYQYQYQKNNTTNNNTDTYDPTSERTTSSSSSSSAARHFARARDVRAFAIMENRGNRRTRDNNENNNNNKSSIFKDTSQTLVRNDDRDENMDNNGSMSLSSNVIIYTMSVLLRSTGTFLYRSCLLFSSRIVDYSSHTKHSNSLLNLDFLFQYGDTRHASEPLRVLFLLSNISFPVAGFLLIFLTTNTGLFSIATSGLHGIFNLIAGSQIGGLLLNGGSTSTSVSTASGMMLNAANGLSSNGVGVSGGSNELVFSIAVLLAGLASHVFHAAQVRLGPNKKKVKMLLVADYAAAFLAAICGLKDAIELALIFCDNFRRNNNYYSNNNNTDSIMIVSSSAIITILTLASLAALCFILSCFKHNNNNGTNTLFKDALQFSYNSNVYNSIVYIICHALWHVFAAATAVAIGLTHHQALSLSQSYYY